jgi:kynurenine/2-aminoadipate aminotransferase
VYHSKFISRQSQRRQPSVIRSLMPLTRLPGMISLGGGNPAPQLFPFKGISFTLADGKTIALTDGEVAEALQYSPTPGLPDFVEHLSQLQIREHAPQLPRQVYHSYWLSLQLQTLHQH